MVSIKSQFTILGLATLFAAPLFTSAAIAAPPASAPSSDKLLERPKWLPELPKINTEGFAPDSTVYVELRKRILEKRDKSAIKELEKLAKRGHAPSLVLIGYLLDQEPKLIKTNHLAAAQYWQIAAQAGDSVAIYNLGILYLNGRGVPRNLDTAERLFSIAAEKGMYLAYYMRGQLYERAIKYPIALQEYTKCLGVRYLVQCKTRYGILSVTKVRLNPNEAKRVINLLSEASSQGDLEASYTLARLTAEGLVINKSPSTMVYYLEHLLKAPNTNNNYRSLAAKMYKAYSPTADAIKEGKDNYRISNAGGSGVIVYKVINTAKPVLDAGNIIE